ncbi:MAG TPA: amino acid adenylation domain-containing protein, partial [Longimicrobium sp.]
AAYVPVDPAYPAERIAYMLADSAAPVLVTQRSVARALPRTGAAVVRLDADAEAIARVSAEPFESGARPDSLAYVIYTSGSTGRPKGVAMPHRPLVNLLAWQQRQWRHPAASATLQFTTLSFDVSFQEIFSCWTSGGRLVLVGEDERRDLGAVLQRLDAEGIERLFLPYVALQHLAELAEERGIAPRALREVQTAGEPLRVTPAIRRFFAATGATLANQYGPTETHVATAQVLDGAPDGWPLLPGIGGPVANARCYVLDAAGEPSPIGVPGELYLAGACLARGYLGRPVLTAERFVADPFVPGARMYRTGDRARWQADGRLEFLGRADDQVKVRGFRIEPGEVEAALEAHEAVREAVVVAREDAPGGRRLVGYVVPAPGASAHAAALRAHLQARLPEHMVPDALVVLDAFPLTPSGKVARRALPAPDAPAENAAHVAPRTPSEELLAGIFADVLNVGKVGARDDFFALGGHSLLATRVVSRVREAFGVELPLRDLFDASTVEALAARIDGLGRGGAAAVPAPPIRRISRKKPLPLSFAQQRLWFIDQLEPGRATYNLPYALRLRGRLDVGAMERALSEIVRRHETLRTRFGGDAGAPVQVIDRATPVRIQVVDLSDRPHGEREAALRDLVADEAARPFDLAAGPLLRTTLARLGDDEHALLFTLHHIVSDGWSTGVLVREVSELYGAFAEGRAASLPELPVQYADFAAWQRAWLTGDVLAEQLGWWRERLAGAPPLLELPTDRPRPAAVSDRGGSVPFTLPAQTTRALRELSRREGATLFMTLLAAWQLLLSRYSGQDDVCVGTPIAGRTRLETEGLIGFFINTLVLRTDLSGAPSFRALLGRVREATLGAYQHQDLPFERLVEELAPERALGRTPLFQAMFIVQNNAREALRLGTLDAEPLGGAGEPAKFDLTLSLEEHGEQLAGALQYRVDLFDGDTIQRMLGHWTALLTAVLADPGRPVTEHVLLGDGERRMLEAWNATDAGYPSQSTVHALFAQQAARTPDAFAVVRGDDALTYAELDASADRLAAHLRARGVGAESRVGVCLERGPELIVGLLAVLKAGGAYVPLDPSYPRERLAWMMGDAHVAVLLTQDGLRDALPASDAVAVVSIDGDAAEIAAADPVDRTEDVGPNGLAYVIYTSGSTGTPKGVGVEHRAVVRLVRGANYVSLDDDEAVLHAAPISFDASTFEIWGALLNGARLVVHAGDSAALDELGGTIVRHGVTTMWLTAGLFQVMVDERLDDLGGVRQLLAGGDVLPAASVKRLRARFPSCRVINGYGPTENTTFTACYPVPAGWDGDAVPIGTPVSNTRVHVLDAALRPAPVGVPGELYLAGAGLSRGYLGRPALTAERFVPDPFGRPGARLYRTGDRARWRADGELEFLGRMDHQ